ncbi:MATE family efflux transporter [Geobacillus stearothermophilus]|uniref:MATE family efflux transporter n=1 Tax=Geobacillus TaxID=129337 RepID=UPI0009BF7C89|nr:MULTISPECIES: MATE family efflux transporter [Geobacillus]MED3668689.1 MATE family efflux transporter [Geobacillus kaustophilus]MED4270870.1 MATE family efflux transporter [Geobacillus stearothermophilus]OQP18169.1 MATE family efflux transporter [Geobacillus zalihae]QNU24169.1 MATE family efflux transporter [Geobacillus zalihae]WMJ20604.1 MATE family efflux transporter [Geobacillus kaustophilus]
MRHEAKTLSLFSLTWPIFIETLLYMVMGNADTLMLSQYSDHAVAAVGVANQIIALTIVLFNFVALATAVLVAQYLGARREQEAVDVSLVSLVANLLFGLLLSAILAAFSEPILRMMDLPAELLDEGTHYLAIVGGFLFIQALMMTVGAILKSYGFTRDTMYVAVGMNVLHVISNAVLIFGLFGLPALGIQGAAISTAASRGMAFLALLALLRKRTNIPLAPRAFRRLPFHYLRSLLKIGVPAAGEHLSYNTAQMVITYFITWLGAEALTVRVYTQNIMMFVFLFGIAVSQGTQILVGHFVGAGRYEEAYARCLKSLYSAIAISVLLAAAAYWFAEPLLSLFTDDRSMIVLGRKLLLLTIILEPGRSFNLVIISSLRAAGDVQFPVYMGILSMWGVGVTIAYVFGIALGFGLVGIWLSFIADEWLRGLLMLWRWRSRVWMKKTMVPQAKMA